VGPPCEAPATDGESNGHSGAEVAIPRSRRRSELWLIPVQLGILVMLLVLWQISVSVLEGDLIGGASMRGACNGR
jgi:hypothetical protein